MKRIRLAAQKGFTALEMMVVLIVSVAAIGLGSQYLMSYADTQVNQAAADHNKTISDAAVKYIKDNYAAILATATPSTPATITVPMLKSTGYLTSSVTDQNPYGQTYQILALEPVANKLETLIVTSGGETIPEMDLRRIAQASGARGGVISTTNTAVATGSYGGWQMPLANYGVAPGAGHLATSLFFDDGALVSDYLYRNAVAGHPEFNRMNTAIDMGGNNINNGGTINAQRAVLPGGDNAHSVQVGSTYFYGDSANTAVRSQPGGGFYIQDVNGNTADIKAVNNITASGQVRASNGLSVGDGTVLNSDGRFHIQTNSGGTLYLNPWGNTVQVGGGGGPGNLGVSGTVNASNLVSNNDTYLIGSASPGSGCWQDASVRRDNTTWKDLVVCAGGTWQRAGGSSNGWYVSAGGYSGSTGWIWNNSGKTQFVIASGGTGINRCELSGQINVWGTIVSSGDNNDQWAKTCTITFPVPSGTAWLVTSNPYSEGAGSFSAWVYQ